jgi:hypothetical protein
MHALIPTCTIKKEIRNKPVRPITNFLPIDEVKNSDHFICALVVVIENENPDACKNSTGNVSKQFCSVFFITAMQQMNFWRLKYLHTKKTSMLFAKIANEDAAMISDGFITKNSANV